MITPEEETLAIVLSLDDHLSDLSLASEGNTVACAWYCSSTSRVTELLLSFTPVAGRMLRTSQVALKPPSVLVAVITA